MILIVGGAWQGKLTWAVKEFGFTPEELCDLASGAPTPDAPMPGRRCYYHLEELTRREEHPERYLPLWQDAVVISREIGCGIVPMKPEERAWRERHGTLLRCLAQRSEKVYRVFCGLTEEWK